MFVRGQSNIDISFMYAAFIATVDVTIYYYVDSATDHLIYLFFPLQYLSSAIPTQDMCLCTNVINLTAIILCGLL